MILPSPIAHPSIKSDLEHHSQFSSKPDPAVVGHINVAYSHFCRPYAEMGAATFFFSDISNEHVKEITKKLGRHHMIPDVK